MTTAYADSSFLVRLLVAEREAVGAVAAHRNMGRPHLYFSSLHELEVPNAIRLRTFMAVQRQPRIRAHASRVQEEALRRLDLSLKVGRFVRLRVQWEDSFTGAAELSQRHAVRLGVRSFDLLHVQLAISSPSKDFLTCDARQASLAKAAGLKVTLVQP